MTPQKYPQTLHTPNNIYFSEIPKNIEIQNFEPPKRTRAYVSMKILEYPPPPPRAIIVTWMDYFVNRLLVLMEYLTSERRKIQICDPSREKGRVGCHIVKFTFSAFWIENCMTNQKILTCWWVLDNFGSQNVQRRWVPTTLERHKLSIDVIITLHVHHKIWQINTRYEILPRNVTMYLL